MGWGKKFDVSDPDPSQMVRICSKEFEDNYSSLNADGIYIQSFTETKDEFRDGLLIGQAVTKWINTISGCMLDKHPDLHIYLDYMRHP
jgi:hypothetical protein